MIYTHSHVDHFGGVRGVIDEVDVTAGKVEILAPARFMEAVTKENVLAGIADEPARAVPVRRAAAAGSARPGGRRSRQDGHLARHGHPDPAHRDRSSPIETRTIDGVEIIFQLAPETEAPAEMHMFYFPPLRALNLAENATHNLHNIYPIRGAQVRDANPVAKLPQRGTGYGSATRPTWCSPSTHWPVVGQARVAYLLSKQRDTYKYLHDQTVRLMNHGYKAAEIAEPAAPCRRPWSTEWHVRGYYGTFSHNAKAVYQRYLGWYDANPANLNPLPPAEHARKTCGLHGRGGGGDCAGARGLRAGRIPLGGEAMSQVVFAEPANREARELGADALEQLGYAAESGNVAQRLPAGGCRTARRHAADARA